MPQDLAWVQFLQQDGSPIAFESRKLLPAEQNYTTTEQELLGVVHALKVWRCYLEGEEEFTVYTDHRANTFLDVQPTLSRRQTRWLEFLSRFHIKWSFKKGVDNPADPLSRVPAFKSCATLIGKFNKLSMLSVVTRGGRRKPNVTLPKVYQDVNDFHAERSRSLSAHPSLGYAGRPGLRRHTPKIPPSLLQLPRLALSWKAPCGIRNAKLSCLTLTSCAMS